VTCGSCMREQPTCQSACSIEGGRRAQPQLEREACSPFLPILAPVLTLPKELTPPYPTSFVRSLSAPYLGARALLSLSTP